MTSPDHAQKHLEALTFEALGLIPKIILFFTLGGLLWWASNDFVVYAPKGFDPLRYEYFARFGLPNGLQNLSSYRIVFVLEYVYTFLPYYWGFLLFLATISFSIVYFDSTVVSRIALFSPISLYYLSQTGKDGITTLAAIAVAILVSSKRINFVAILLGIFIISLSAYIRPAVILILPLVAIQFRFGTFYSLLFCPILLIAFAQTIDFYDTLSIVEGASMDEGSGRAAQILRSYSFGYEIGPISGKIGLLLTSLLFQPALAIAKWFSSNQNFLLFESICFGGFAYMVVRSRMLIKFLVASLPYVVVLGFTTPFYHFRYLAFVYPVIWAFCRWSRAMGWTKPSIGVDAAGSLNKAEAFHGMQAAGFRGYR